LVEPIFEKVAEKEKCFFCEDGKVLRSVNDLQEELKVCNNNGSRDIFDTHVNENKNDFANWVRDVFNLDELAKKMNETKDPISLLAVLEEYKKEISETKEIIATNEYKENSSVKDVELENKKEEDVQDFFKSTSNDADEISELKKSISSRSDRSEQTLDKLKKLKQHSFYNKTESEGTVEDIKERYNEISRAISEHRKEGQDMSIPSMMLRNAMPKINYFQISQNKEDYQKAGTLLDDIEQEIDYAKKIKSINLKEEILQAASLVEKKKSDGE
jgi:hypothetical protein